MTWRSMIVAALSGASVASAQNVSLFSGTVYPVLEQAGCRACHTPDGVASATRLQFPEPGASKEQIEAFGIALAALVDRSDPPKSLLVLKPSNRIKHTGGERIPQGSDDEKTLLQWVRTLAAMPEETIIAARKRLSAGDSESQPDQLLRRLTHSQYNNTIRDLLGDHSQPADRFPPEDFVNGFKNQLRTQGMPALLADAYSIAAEKLALNAFRAGDVNGLAPCKPSSAADVKCRDAFVRAFGRRAFRRPLTEPEFKRYTALFAAQARLTGKFLEGARVAVEAILQSPKFLFHREIGPGAQFPAYETASRLSYLLWDTMPDATLLDEAASGALATIEGREKAARRMLNDPRARPALDEFFAQWLRFDRVLSTVKDRRRYPEFTPELAATMVEETKRLLGHLVWNDRSFMEALTADYTFLRSELSSLYGLPAPPGEFELIRFPATMRRAGLLGQASFLAATAGPVETSATARGIFVREQLLCQHVPNPPPGVSTALPEPTPEQPRTRRQLLQAHAENPACASCHRLMDPIGFGLENFDGIGRWREKETIEFRTAGSQRGGRGADLDLDPTGEIAGIPNSAFSDPRDLGRVLAGNRACQECVVKQVFRYATGRMETPADRSSIADVYTSFRDSGFRMKELLVALVRSPQFMEGAAR